MPGYKYTARDENGRTIKGFKEAADEKSLYNALKLEGKFLISSKSGDDVRQKDKGRIKINVVADFCRQLGTLLQAGVSLVRALSIIADEEGLKPKYRAVYLEILQVIRQGVPLSDAMEQQGSAFPALLINMIRAAEANGNIDVTSMRMADHYEKERKLNGKVKSALIYPTVLGILLVCVIIFVLVYLVPQFEDVFAEMASLPLPTVILLGLSNGIKNHWPIILIVLTALFIILRIVFRIPAVRLAKDRFKLRIPIVGGLLRKIYTARFARTLSSLYSSGLPIVLALQVGCRTIGNTYIESQFERIIARVRAGEALSAALSEVDGFQQKLSATIRVGEETGSLDSMLDSIADSLDYEATRALEKMVSLLEPLLIIVMAVVIGFVVIAVILPIYQSYSTIGQGAEY